MGLRSLFKEPLDYKVGGVLISIVLVFLVIPFKTETGITLGYGKAWAFASALRWVDQTILTTFIGEKFVLRNPHWSIFAGNLDVAVTLLFFVLGSFVAALLSEEFGIRVDKSSLPESIVGGILMGIGIVFITTCNVGTFLNSLPQIALGAYLAGIGLIIGTYIGAKYYEKKMGL
jgi:hypothetical protein